MSSHAQLASYSLYSASPSPRKSMPPLQDGTCISIKPRKIIPGRHACPAANLISKIPRRCAQRLVSQVIPDPSKLTINSNITLESLVRLPHKECTIQYVYSYVIRKSTLYYG